MPYSLLKGREGSSRDGENDDEEGGEGVVAGGFVVDNAGCSDTRDVGIGDEGGMVASHVAMDLATMFASSICT